MAERYVNKNLIRILMILCLTSLSFGQYAENHLIVTVRDQFEGNVNGAKITVISKNDNKSRVFNTDSNGIAKFDNLPDADYQILVKADGFSEYASPVFTLKSGETKKININLEILPIEEKVNVDGNSEINGDSYGATKTLTAEQIELLPDDPAELARALQRLAGESVTGGSLPISVNGIVTDQLPRKEDIQSVTFYRSIFSAQFEGTSGERIEIVTKSSRAKFGGRFDANFGDAVFNARNPFLIEKSPFQSKGGSIYLYGPLTDKIAWSAFSELSNTESGTAVNAVILDSDLQPVFFNAFQSNPNHRRTSSVSLNANPSERSRLNFNYSLTTNSNENLGSGGFVLPSRAFNTKNNSHSVRFNYTYVFNPKVVNAVKGSFQHSAFQLTSSGDQVGINVADSFYGGSSFNNRRSSALRSEFYDDVSISRGKLDIGFGLMVRITRNTEKSKLAGGTYFFNGRNAPLLDADNNVVTDPQGNVVTGFINSLESYRRTLLFARAGFTPAQIRALGGGASQLTISGGDSDIFAKQTDYAGYLQIGYSPFKNLSTSFGLRYENQSNIKSNLDFAPRFGIIWSPESKKKTSPLFAPPKISAGFGFFFSRFGIENLLNSRRTLDSGLTYYSITNSDVLDSFPNLPTPAALEQSSIGRSTLTIDNGFKSPFQMIANLNLTKSVTKNSSANISFSSISGFRQTVTRNINAPLAGTYNENSQNAAVYPFISGQSIFRMFSKGKSDAKRLNVSFNANDLPILKRKIGFGVSYSFTKGQSNIVNGNSNYLDPYDFSGEYAPSIVDGVHRVSAGLTTMLFDSVFFNINSVFRTGLRFNIITGRDSNGDGYFDERPAFASNLDKPGVIFTEYGAFDPNPGFGDKIIPRNFGRGPGYLEFNLIASKIFRYGVDKKSNRAKRKLEITAKINNLFNTNNQGNPVGNISSPYFLQSVAANSLDGIGKISESRSINFTASFTF